MDNPLIQVRKVLVAGTVGVGKTTAVRAVSDDAAITTEAAPSDSTLLQKDTTTVAMDFSVVWLDDYLKIHLYGTPGQERFDFMWDVLTKGAAGVILLADHSSPNVFDQMQVYLDGFEPMLNEQKLVLGVTRLEGNVEAELQLYRDHFNRRGLNVPVLEADPRSRHDIIVLIRASLATNQLSRKL